MVAEVDDKNRINIYKEMNENECQILIVTAGKILEVVEDTDLVITIDQGNQRKTDLKFCCPKISRDSTSTLILYIYFK